jgi:hypothetical protein
MGQSLRSGGLNVHKKGVTVLTPATLLGTTTLSASARLIRLYRDPLGGASAAANCVFREDARFFSWAKYLDIRHGVDLEPMVFIVENVNASDRHMVPLFGRVIFW